jgi:hypothetical protein
LDLFLRSVYIRLLESRRSVIEMLINARSMRLRVFFGGLAGCCPAPPARLPPAHVVCMMLHGRARWQGLAA